MKLFFTALFVAGFGFGYLLSGASMPNFVIDRPDIYIIGLTILLMYSLGAWKNKLPSTGAVHSIVSMLDTKGGNILILGALAIYFFHRTEEMYYAVMALVQNGKLTSDNGVALNGLLFANGAFSGVSGALLKVMTGTEPPALIDRRKVTPGTPVPQGGEKA